MIHHYIQITCIKITITQTHHMTHITLYKIKITIFFFRFCGMRAPLSLYHFVLNLLPLSQTRAGDKLVGEIKKRALLIRERVIGMLTTRRELKKKQ